MTVISGMGIQTPRDNPLMPFADSNIVPMTTLFKSPMKIIPCTQPTEQLKKIFSEKELMVEKDVYNALAKCDFQSNTLQ